MWSGDTQDWALFLMSHSFSFVEEDLPPLVMAGGAVGPSGFGVRPHFSFAHLHPKTAVAVVGRRQKRAGDRGMGVMTQ